MITIALRKRTHSPVRLVLEVTFFCCYLPQWCFFVFWGVFTRLDQTRPSTHYPLYDFDLRATHARTLLPAALASVSFGFVLVRVRSTSKFPPQPWIPGIPLDSLGFPGIPGYSGNSQGSFLEMGIPGNQSEHTYPVPSTYYRTCTDVNYSTYNIYSTYVPLPR